MNSKQVLEYKLAMSAVGILFIIIGAWLQILTVKEAWNELFAPIAGLANIGFTKAFAVEVAVGVMSGRYWSKAERLSARSSAKEEVFIIGAHGLLSAALTYGLVNLVAYLLIT